MLIFRSYKVLVLIETSWNVKCECISFFYLIHSINRNIVEYKVLKVYTTYIRILRINRNIVECKEILIDEFNNNMLHFIKVRV